MKLKGVIILIILSLFINTTAAFALIKIDDESIDLAIKYSLRTKELSTENILGANWLNDGTGKILNIYSPFIQVVMKSNNQSSTGNTQEDLKNIKSQLNNEITKIKDKNEIRFIVALFGDNKDFAQKYKAYIIDKEKFINSTKDKAVLKPKKSSLQKIADKDEFNPNHPFSAINCYSFKFDDLFKIKEYYFIIESESGEQIKYMINNEDIY